jgi:serine/threonine protein kinase
MNIHKMNTMQWKAGDLFDHHYRLIRKLGNGGFSEVWLAEDLRVHALKVALKIYTSAQAQPGDLETFIKKFELVYNLNHTHLLPPNACGEYKGRLYLVLRYCERGSSSSLAGNIREAEAWHFLHDVACGLEYLHQKNIIHQDIKPDNVLITGDNRYLITDFDISAKARTTQRLGGDAPAGTSAYMAPERFGSVSAPIKASDIWALGASLYELISTHLPFGELGGLNQKNGAEAPPIQQPISKVLKDMMALCLQPEPWDRPTAEEIGTWCDLHFKKEKIRFDKKYIRKLQAAKKDWKKTGGIGLAAAVAIGLLAIGIASGITGSRPSDAGKAKPMPESAVEPLPLPDTLPEALPQTPPTDWKRLDQAKTNALKNFEFAQKMNDADYYTDALSYCDSALLLLPDDREMLALKKKIEATIK